MQGGGEAVVDDLKIAEHKIIEEWNEIRRVAMDTCRCTNFNCGCCAHLEESEIHLNSTSKNVVITRRNSASLYRKSLSQLLHSYAVISQKKFKLYFPGIM